MKREAIMVTNFSLPPYCSFPFFFYYFIQFVKKNKNPTFVIWQGYQCPMVIEERYQVAKARAKELSNDNGIF